MTKILFEFSFKSGFERTFPAIENNFKFKMFYQNIIIGIWVTFALKLINCIWSLFILNLFITNFF